MGSWIELRYLTWVRVLLFIREPEAVFWVFMFPVVLAIVLGWAFMERGVSPAQVGVHVVAEDRSVAELLSSSEHIEVDEFADIEDARRALRVGKIAVLVLPGADQASGTGLELDPQRPEAEVARLRVEKALWSENHPDALADVEVEEISETGSRYIDWLFPGLLGMSVMSTGVWGIGFCLAEWRQKKLLRRFLVTPMRRSSFLGAFVLSRFVFLVAEVGLLLLFGTLLLDVPLRGSLIGFATLVALGGLTFSGLGILVAARTRTIEGVSGLMNFVMMPMWLFSGIFFSYDRFPEVTHPFIQALPLTALNDSLRALMLEGASLASLWPAVVVQAAWGIGCFLLALKIFRWE